MISDDQVIDAPPAHFWALKDISFEINAGERVGIIGQNGSGKSTLLKILSRITAPTVGQFRQRGHLISLLEVGTGFHIDLSGRENVYLNASINGMSRKQINEKFDEIVEFSELGEHIDSPVKRYSSGMYMRLAFSVAAFLESEILLIDEVLAVGDAGFQKKCKEKMLAVANQGRTLLFVSHDMDAVQTICSKAIELSHGRIKDVKTVIPPTQKKLEKAPIFDLSPSSARPQTAMFFECSAPFWQNIALKLKETHGLTPVYWTGLRSYQEGLKSVFPELYFHDCVDAKRNIPIAALTELSQAPFDEICQDIWKEEAQVVYDMLNRFDHSNNFTFNQRKLYFYEALVYWNAVIKKINPTHIIFPNPPHATYDHIVFSIAKKRNIQTIIFEKSTDYQFGNPPDSLEVTPEAKKYLDQLTQEVERVPGLSDSQSENAKGNIDLEKAESLYHEIANHLEKAKHCEQVE